MGDTPSSMEEAAANIADLKAEVARLRIVIDCYSHSSQAASLEINRLRRNGVPSGAISGQECTETPQLTVGLPGASQGPVT